MEVDDRKVVLKEGFSARRCYAIEKETLDILRSTQTVAVPEVYAAGEDFLCMEFIPSKQADPADWYAFGQDLAHMHQADTTLYSTKRYGYLESSFLGLATMENTPEMHWPLFFAKHRLQVEVDQMGPGFEKDRLQEVIDRIDTWLVEPERPSILHGDLWIGNVLFDRSGKAVLIDPALYVGDREVDLAMTELFGGFDPAFYKGYNDVYPLSEGYSFRKHIYQLYYLLVHLNLFGEAYLEAVRLKLDRILGESLYWNR